MGELSRPANGVVTLLEATPLVAGYALAVFGRDSQCFGLFADISGGFCVCFVNSLLTFGDTAWCLYESNAGILPSE